MTNQLSIPTPQSGMPPRDHYVTRLIDYFQSSGLPAVDERRDLLDMRWSELAKTLAHHDRQAIGQAITDMLLCYRNVIRPDEDAKAVVVKYVSELHGMPTWACVEACNMIRRGTAEGVSTVFAPSTIAVRKLADGIAAPFRAELDAIVKILTLKTVTMGHGCSDTEYVGTGLKKLADHLRNGLKSE